MHPNPVQCGGAGPVAPSALNHPGVSAVPPWAESKCAATSNSRTALQYKLLNKSEAHTLRCAVAHAITKYIECHIRNHFALRQIIRRNGVLSDEDERIIAIPRPIWLVNPCWWLIHALEQRIQSTSNPIVSAVPFRNRERFEPLIRHMAGNGGVELLLGNRKYSASKLNSAVKMFASSRKLFLKAVDKIDVSRSQYCTHFFVTSLSHDNIPVSPNAGLEPQELPGRNDNFD